VNISIVPLPYFFFSLQNFDGLRGGGKRFGGGEAGGRGGSGGFCDGDRDYRGFQSSEDRGMFRGGKLFYCCLYLCTFSACLLNLKVYY